MTLIKRDLPEKSQNIQTQIQGNDLQMPIQQTICECKTLKTGVSGCVILMKEATITRINHCHEGDAHASDHQSDLKEQDSYLLLLLHAPVHGEN